MNTWSRRAPLLWGLAALVVILLVIYRAPGLSTLLLGAFIVAYVYAPFVDRLSRRLPRGFAVAIVMGGATVLLLGFLLLFVPLFSSQYRVLVDRLPQLFDYIQAAIPRIEARLGIDLPNGTEDLATKLREQLSNSAGQIATISGHIAQRTFGGVAGVIGLLINFAVLVPLLAFYLLLNYHAAWPSLLALVPPRHAAAVNEIKTEIDAVLSGFIRGQLTVALIIGILLAVGFSIVGIGGAVVIGLLGGLLNMIPLVGAIIGHSLAILMALLKFGGWTPIIGVIVVIVISGALESTIITPRIIGNKVGLPPLVVLLAVLGGGELFGFAGTLLAVPAAAVIKVLLSRAKRHYMKSEAYAATPDSASAHPPVPVEPTTPPPSPTA